MKRDDFLVQLGERPLLLDGSMGALIHAKGVPADSRLDAVNLQNPSIVAEIHREYIEAGADIIETNSFAANRFKLAEHGLTGEVVAINQAAVDVARRVIASSFKPVLLAGSIGPLGATLAPLGRVSVAQAKEAFTEQIEALLTAGAGGVDLLILETMSDFKELKTAVSAARTLSQDIPIVAQMTFTRDDRTLLGLTPDEAARKLAELDVDVIGVNCSTGPANVLRIVSMMHEAVPERPLSAAPNAGWPEQVEGGRVMYPATPAYFGEYARSFVEAGARIVGGCCGTRAEHIQAMRAALDNPLAVKRPLPTIQIAERGEDEVGTAVSVQPTQMAQDLAAGKFIVTVEMSPPRGIATERLLAGAKMLKEAGATMLNLADSPLARMHMSAWAAAHLVQQNVGVEAVLHFPTRGRNLLRIQGDLLAAHAMGIRNLFVVMGDPTRIGDFPEAMDSYDIVPTGLIQLIKQQLNQGVDKAGQSIDQATNFTVGCAVSLTPKDAEREMRLLHKKIANGADFALTQPVFDPAAAKKFIETYEATYEEPMLPLVTGIKPLYNSRNAEFLHHEVPGMIIPEEQRERMKQAKKPKQEGVLIAQETLAQVKEFSHGTYLMSAFGRYDLVADVIDSIDL